MRDWITVKECADLIGVRPQAIYKKLHHETAPMNYQDHVKKVNGVIFLDSKAVELIALGHSKKKSKEPMIDEVISIMRKLDKASQEKILNFAKNAYEFSKY